MVIEPTDLPRPAPGPRPDDGVPVVVEPMRRRHLRSVLAIEEATNPHPWSRRLFVSELSYPDGRVYRVVRVGRTIVGYVGIMLMGDDGHITNLGLRPDYRRRGLASRLLVDALRRTIAEGATALTLEVRASNHGAQQLYRRFGFVPVGTRAGYYADNGEDALIMWATDVTEPAYRDRLTTIENALESNHP